MVHQSVRFNDTDVRTYPQLTDIAIEYAADYAGEWEFMVAARSLAIQSGTLPTATARAVLNAMRADPKVVMSLPELCDLEPAPKHERVERVERDAPQRQVDNSYAMMTVVETVRYPFNVEIRWNLDFYVSVHKQATVSHLLNHERSHLRYYPMFGKPGFHHSIKSQYDFDLIAECGVRLRTGHLFASDMGRFTCRSCQTLREVRRLDRIKENLIKGNLYE